MRYFLPKFDILLSRFSLKIELVFVVEPEWKRGRNHREAYAFCTKYCTRFVAEHEWKRVWSHRVAIAKRCVFCIVLTIICAFFCTSCVPFLVILETIIGHSYPKLTVFGSNNDHFWVPKVSCVPFLVQVLTDFVTETEWKRGWSHCSAWAEWCGLLSLVLRSRATPTDEDILQRFFENFWADAGSGLRPAVAKKVSEISVHYEEI